MGKKKDTAGKAQAQPILITSLDELDAAIKEAGELESTMVEIARQHALTIVELRIIRKRH